jgi:hypothetical protein
MRHQSSWNMEYIRLWLYASAGMTDRVQTMLAVYKWPEC